MTTLLFPLYIYPANGGKAWAPLVSAARVRGRAENILAIVNPDNGPGRAISEDYASAISSLSLLSLPMAGYLYTNYGERPLDVVIEDVADWRRLYPQVRHLFIDNMANVPGLEHYYSSIARYAKSVGLGRVIGNPGTSTASSYFKAVDTIIVYEQTGYPTSLETLARSLEGRRLDPRSLGFIAHDVEALDFDFIRMAAQLMEFICLTRSYDEFPPYFEELLDFLAKM